MPLIKIVVVLSVAVVTLVAHDIPPEYVRIFEALHQKCQAETGVTEDQILDANNGKFADDNVLKCYMKCMMVKTSVMSEDGVLDAETLIAMIPEDYKETLTKTTNKCKTLVGSDPCDTAFKLHKCYYENNPEYYLLV